MKLKATKSLRSKIILLYILMTIINITLLILVISDNQAEILTQNARYKAREMLDGVSQKLMAVNPDFSEGGAKRKTTEKVWFSQLDSQLAPLVKAYAVSDENGKILHESAKKPKVPANFVENVRKSIAGKEYAGSEYYPSVDDKAEAIHFYYPLQAANRILYIPYSLSEVHGKYNKLYLSIILMVAVVLALHLFMAIYLYRLIIFPLFQLMMGTRDIAQGNYEARIELVRDDEIGAVADGFNTMAEKISGNVLELQGMVEKVNQSNRKLEKLATVDELTGLHNRRFFYSAIKKEIDMFFRYSQVFSLILLDIDHFKTVNDTYGHEAGDIVLKELASVLCRTSRETDQIVRYGGEEFILLLPNTETLSAFAKAERIREDLQKSTITIGGGLTLHVTASFGVCDSRAIAAADKAHFMELAIAAADKALYVSKEKGRNRTEIYSSEGI